MAERDASARLRRAVQENNLFLVKRLIKRIDMRNPDPNTKRYTSLAWAAVQESEETFNFLLHEGHDDEELSKDSDNNTVLTLLADLTCPLPNQYCSTDAALRMARAYYDKYPFVRDWANSQGKTALHNAAMRGNEELVRMLCDLGADFDLPDNQGNAPLHYASAWGHIPIVQLLIERGCQFSARNNEGFTASDYAYSLSIRDTLQDSARVQFENNKRTRRQVFAQAAARGTEWPSETNGHGVQSPASRQQKILHRGQSIRMRSGSAASGTTGTSDSDFDTSSLAPGQYSNSPVSSPSVGSTQLPFGGLTLQTPQGYSSSSSVTTSIFSAHSPSQSLNPSLSIASTLSPIATRMLERDADAIEKYKLRNRSGSSGTTSTDVLSQNGSSVGPSVNGEEILPANGVNGSVTPRRLLRPSASAAQLRDSAPNSIFPLQEMLRTRSGTNPSARKSPPADVTSFAGTQYVASSRPTVIPESPGSEQWTEPNETKAQSPPLRAPAKPSSERHRAVASAARRIPFHILSKPLPSIDPQISHRRGTSTT